MSPRNAPRSPSPKPRSAATHGPRALGALLLLIGAGCATAGGADGPSRAGGPAAESAPGDDGKEAREAAWKLESSRRDLDVAKLQLQLAEHRAKESLRKKREARTAAERKLERAQDALALFETLRRPKELDEARLSIDRGRYSMEEAQAELDELLLMYAEEEFAETTKELVIQRGKRNLETSTRSLELRERGLAIQERGLEREHEELEWNVKEAKRDLGEARRAIDEAELDSEIDLAQAMGRVRDIEHDIAELEREATEEEKVAVAAGPGASSGAGSAR